MSTLSSFTLQVPDLILANPTAGGGLGSEGLARLRSFAAEKHWNAEFRSAQSSAEFVQVARDEAGTGRERIFALGGDGTFQALLNAVAGSKDVSIGVLPAGGGNDLAAALELPLDPVKAAGAILTRGEAIPLDAARVRTADGAERLYMGGGGIGLDAEAARFANGAYRKMRGRSRYLLSAVRALWGFRGIGVRVSMEGAGQSFLQGTALVLGILNTPSYGGGLRIAPEASLSDGRLDLVLLETLGVLEIASMLPRLAVSGEIRTERIQRHCVTRARIETERPCAFHADGEIIGMTPVEIMVVPEVIRVWRPGGKITQG
ncbi:MAG TPA: diacylglycerol kinase family protein [Candidatus Sulfotelmatobacter sp.]|nr:diacylglycerol kinase family protein [Candidatus Sulfotelmatobacter sp.]